MIHIIIILAVIIAIALGFKTKINTGLFGILFAYIIGAFIFDFKTSEIINMWPTSIFFVFFSVSLFFGMANANGTMQNIAQHIVYSSRKAPVLIPYAIFFASWLTTALGVTVMGGIAFMAPLAIALANQLKVDKLAIALCASFGAMGGANFVIGGNGVIFMGLLDNIGYTNSASIVMTTFAVSTIYFLLVCTGYMVITKSFGQFFTIMQNFEKPETMNRNQKNTLMLIVVLFMLVLFVPVLKTITSLEVFAVLNSRIHIGPIAIVLTIVGLMMKTAEQKDVFAKVPWNTLVMLCGVGMVVELASKAGTLKVVGELIGMNVHTGVVPALTSLLGSIMSFFSSTAGVVAPALFPIVPSLAATTGLSDGLLVTAIIIGAQATAISPFSTGGALLIASATNDKDRNYMFKIFITRCVPILSILAAALALVLSLFL